MNSKKEKRSRRDKNTRRNKKRNGGASGASGASASSPKLTRAQKIQRLLGAPGGPESGLSRVLTRKLLSGMMDMPPRKLEALGQQSIRGHASMKLVEDETFKMAEQLHATSFRYRTPRIIAGGDLQMCIHANVKAVKQLREAIGMDILRANACLADMLLNGYTAGVSKNVREAMSLVSEVDDPDCQGVLAHCHFNDGIKAGPALAARSAARGSKYGQYVVGLYEMQKGKTNEAAKYFTLAAAQNYDEAQIALSKMQSDPDETLRLLNLAADQGNSDAFYSIAKVYRRKSNDNPHTKAFRDAMDWCNLAVNANHPYSFDELISMQKFGL